MERSLSSPAPAQGPPTHPERHTVEITGLNHDGRGVGRLEGKVVFVDGALPGERVAFRFLRRRRNYDSGVVAEVLRPSPQRVAPRCEHFGVCGGCALQHLEPSAQVELKQGLLAEDLERIARTAPERWLEPLRGPRWGYRRKARLGARWVPKKGGLLIGFREKRSTYITGLNRCHILDARVGGLLPALRELAAGLSCARRLPQIEVAAGDEAVALVFRHLLPLTGEDEARLCAFGREHGIRIYKQPGGPDTIVPLWPEAPAPLFYDLPEQEIRIRFRPTDFTQVNAAVNAQMVARALELLEPGPDDRVLDLFCGLGNFTLPVARRVKTVLGLEADALLIAGARANAEDNGLDNARFQAADLYTAGERPPWNGFDFNKVLLDPPRSGAMEVIKQLPPEVERVVYVSCNPATLARDAAYLVQVRGYRLSRAGILDMFPHTTHVESIALFLRSPA